MKYLLLLLFTLQAFAAFTPFPPVVTPPDVVVTKGGLLTSTGAAQVENVACANGSIVEWDSGVANGLKCVVNPVTQPSGMVSAFAGTVAPAGWLLCDGSAVSRVTYAALYAVVGDAFGNGDGSTTFNLPDTSGRFIRGVDGAAGNDPNAGIRTAMAAGGNTGDAVGSIQGDATDVNGLVTSAGGIHAHDISYRNDPVGAGAAGGTLSSRDGSLYRSFSTGIDTLTGGAISAGSHAHTVTSADSETRPTNFYMNYIIKI